MKRKQNRQKKEPNKLPRRIQRIRTQFYKAKPSISIARAKATTEVYKENPGLPTVLLRAKAFYRACETIPININDDELIVGHPCGKRRAGVFCPEISWRWLENEIDSIDKRSQDPYVIEEEDKKILREEIFPFWEGKSIDEYVYGELEHIGILPITFESGIIDGELKNTNGAGEISVDYGNIVLKKGFKGIKKEAEKSLKKFDLKNDEDIDKIYFLNAVTIICDAMVLLGRRYSRLASGLAKKEKNEERKRELKDIAEICQKVAGKPAKNFREALQLLWFAQVGLFLEENAPSYSPGRIDQYLYPYYKQDVDSEVLTRDKAKELMCCFLMKFNEVPWVLSQFAAMYYAGYMSFQNINLGGQTRSGKDATNDLSYIFLDCAKELKMYQPSISVRVHNNTPQEFLLKIGEVVRTGIGFPAVHFDDTTIKMMLSIGASLEDPRDYCVLGCVEPSLQGKLSQWSACCLSNFPICVEFALSNGVQLVSNKKLGIETGDPKTFKTFEEFEAAVKIQLKHLIKISAIVSLISQRAHKDYLPKPVASSFMEGCIESGKEIMKGGAKYNTGPGIIFAGTADYANSMATIKKLIFEDKTMSMQRLYNALKNNFEGYKDVYKACINAPKYGNDDAYVDAFANDIVDFAAMEVNRYNGLHGKMTLGTLPVASHVPQGLVVGALPSGRKATLPLADGISPAQGTDKKGPTAVIKSVDKINLEVSTVGVLHNMKIDPSLLADDRGLTNFAAMLRTHNQLGGAHIQFNCVDPDTLFDAQENPDNYKDLMIRVAGYSAYFVELCKEIQDEIISRTVQTNW